LIACWAEDPNGEAYKLHLGRIPDNYWVAEDGLKIQVLYIWSPLAFFGYWSAEIYDRKYKMKERREQKQRKTPMKS
jgi:hypothetical protein